MKETYLTHKEGQKEDHYELTCEQWRKKFLQMDHSELCRRFHLKSDADALYIVYYDQEYRLDRRNGMITLADDPEQKLPYMMALCCALNLYAVEKAAEGRFK